MQVEKQQLELNMEQQADSKLGKEYVSAAYCCPAYLTSMQSTSCKILGWMNHKQIKIARRNINIRYHSDGRKQRGTKVPLNEGERGE